MTLITRYLSYIVAAVKVKFGGSSEYIHQLCYNHGIHLAVVDVIYKSITNSNVDQSDSDSDITVNEYNPTSDEFSESDIDVDTVAQRDKGDDKNTALQMVRKIVKFFKCSPKRNSIQQEYVKEKYGISLSLLLDCKTRWNSIVIMVERFLKVVDKVWKALEDFCSLTLLNENNVPVFSNICNALKPIKLAAEALGRRDLNLIMAYAISKFLLESLRENNDNFSLE